MPEVVVTLDDGREMVFEYTDPTAEGRGIVGTVLQGATLGYADELAGLIGGAPLRDQMRRDVAQFRQDFPKTATGMEVLGSLPVGGGIGAGIGAAARGAGAAGRLGRALSAPAILPQAGLGAVEGAIAGAGGGTTPEQRTQGALMGSVLGGLTGGAMGPVAGAITRRAAPGMQAERMVQSTLSQDLGRAPTAADFADIQRQATIQPQATLAELAGPTTQDLARTSARTPTGGARTLAEGVLEERRRSGSTRLAQSLSESTGSREDYWRNIRNLEEQAKTDAAPAYEAARAAPFAPDAELLDLAQRGIDTGEIKSGYEAARKQARMDEGLELPTWRELTEEGGPGIESLGLNEWDLIKRGLDSRYKQLVRTDPGMARSVWGLRQKIVNKLDQIVPEYSEARQLYAGPAAQIDAQKAGRNIFKEDAEYTEEFVRELSKGEKDAYITGAVQAIKDKLKNVSPEGGMPRITELALDRLRNAFPDDEAYDSFVSQVFTEREMQRFRNFVLGGSQTADILGSRQEAGRMLGAASGIGQIIGGQPVEGIRNVASAVRSRSAPTIPGSVNEPLSQMLFSQGSGLIPQLQRLQSPPIAPRALSPFLASQAALSANQLQRAGQLREQEEELNR